MDLMSLSNQAPLLRAINYRLSSTPVKNLPLCAAQIAASLWSVRNVLSASTETLKPSPELSGLVHRFKASLSSLLQDRTVEGRWAAVVITKAAVEAGGLETLGKTGIWVKSLLSILKKPDPPTTRILVVITLTRIFSLTWDHSQLVREITTPALPAFIASCLTDVEHTRCTPDELQTVLEAFATLLPRHPTIFRTLEEHIRKTLARILSGPSADNLSGFSYTSNHVEAAQTVFVLLHHCAVKQGGSEKWQRGLKWAVSAAHETCNSIFRSVFEDSAPPAANDTVGGAGGLNYAKDNGLELTPWTSIYAGSARLATLLGLIEIHMSTTTSNAVNVPIGLIFELLRRILTVTIPVSPDANSARLNPEVARNEREALFSNLAHIHVATLAVVGTVLARFGIAMASTAQNFTELLEGLFADEHSNPTVRNAVLGTVNRILEIAGPSLSKENVVDLTSIMKACCDDLLAMDKLDKDLHISAQSLLPQLFSRIDQANISRQIRVQMERTAVLANHREALLACVMYPARKDNHATLQPSLLPILASLHSESLESEALLRPRMPVVMVAAGEREIGAVNAAENSMSGAIQNGEDQHVSSGPSPTSKPVDDPNLVEEEDSYSSIPQTTTPKTETTGSAPRVDAQPSTKRSAMDSVEDEVQTKRFRLPPLAETPSNLAERRPVEFHERADQKAPSIEFAAQQPNTGSTFQQNEPLVDNQQALIKDDSDGSDLEMPEINPDPDTDTEDEGEEKMM